MSRYSRWQDAMTAQVRIGNFYESEAGKIYLYGFFEDMNRRHAVESRRDPQVLASIQYFALKEAEPVYVGMEFTDLVDHARETFEPEAILPNDPFVPQGFALFPHPLIIHDAPRTENHPGRAPDGEVPVRAISWMPVHNEEVTEGCFWVSFYVDLEDELERDPDDVRWKGVDPSEFRRRFSSTLSLVHQFQWSWGTAAWDNVDHLTGCDEEDEESGRKRAKEQLALVQTFWRLGQQFTPSRIRAPRQLRRDGQRRGYKHDEVTVMVLRRTSGAKRDEPTDRHLTVQFVVRGYWARRHTREGVRQVWVRPHVKGPEGAEFKKTTRAWEVTR